MKMQKVWSNKKYLDKLACKWTVGFFSLLGFIGTFVSLSDIMPTTWPFLYKLSMSGGILCLVWCVSFIVCSIWFEKQKWQKVFAVNNNCHVYVQYGDVFSENVVRNPKERRIIVIPVNRCFDTIVDNDLISEKSLQGIALKQLYATGTYDEETLNKAIHYDLNHRQNMKYEKIETNQKRKGNLKRYRVGTVAEIQASSADMYFFLALSTFDSNLTAHTTQEEYVLAVQRLIEYCNARSQGYPVVIPLIGAGLSKTQNEERAILEFIVKLLRMNRSIISNDIHIVVRNSGKEMIPITGL